VQTNGADGHISVFESQTNAYARIIGAVIANSDKAFHIRSPVFVDVVSGLNFGIGHV